MEQLVKKIKENIRLDQCQKGDQIYIARGMRGATEWFVGHVVLEKIKPIQKNMVQIKYKQLHHPGGKVLKIDLGGESIVERIRNWVSSDGEDAGYYEPKVITYEGIQYRVTNPEELADIPARADRNRQARMAREKEERDRMMNDPFSFTISSDAWARIAMNFMGNIRRGVSDVPQIASDENMKRVTDSKNKPAPSPAI